MTDATSRGRLAGKACLVTGAAAGIGRATALAFARDGARVVLADVDATAAEEAAEALRAEGLPARAAELDVASESAWEACLAEVVAQEGALDVLVNNAGVALGGPLDQTTIEDWRWVMSINLDGAFLGTKHAIRAMRRAGRPGSIVNVCSALAVVGRPMTAAVSASKAGLLNLTKTAALECAARGLPIRVNAVLPGGVDTGIFQGQGWWPALRGAPENRAESARRDITADTPLGRLARPEEIASAILFLASDEASFVTGAALTADGGFTAA
jgi:NAD(P)-dependent dehydrogenase (short-subunit alcohol dehydrogenase family)